MASYMSPGVTQSPVEQFPLGHLWAVVGAVGSVSSSGSSFLIFILCLPYATSLGFSHYSWHPLISPYSSQGPSFLPRMPKDKYEQRFFSPMLGCFYSVPLLHFYVLLLCPAVQSSSAAPRSASPFKPINQSLDVICLLQHVQDLSVLSAWIGQKALIYTGLYVLLVFFCWVFFFLFCLLFVLCFKCESFSIELCSRKNDRFRASGDFGSFSDLVVSFEFWGFLWFSSTSAAALCFSAEWLNPWNG